MPPGERIEFRTSNNNGAALVLPTSPYRESLLTNHRKHIQRTIRAHMTSWMKFCHDTLKRVDLKESDLVFVFSVVKTSHWAIASFSDRAIFDVGVAEVQVGPWRVASNVWGHWKRSSNVWGLSGPEDESKVVVQDPQMTSSLPSRDSNVSRSPFMPSSMLYFLLCFLSTGRLATR